MLTIFQIVISLLLIFMVTIQDGPLDGGLTSAFSGRKLALFNETKERGMTKTFSQITNILFSLFIVSTGVSLFL